ncbi:unnamed protein product [Prunus armeniaca]|uniref:Uncharacterized protein n=1 Tax=Prunus armeniaca TaxID=36596 RepID=A0A6J5WMY6_PRUAR|nr:unnamed protein product [Prunus armeniaca]
MPSPPHSSSESQPLSIDGATTSATYMLPVLSDDQLEVILPRLSDSFVPSAHSISAGTNNCHPMQTRSKSGIIQHRQFLEYSSFIT